MGRIKLNAASPETVRQICINFIEKNQIGSPETIYQSDTVIQNAYDFIKQVCDAVGYYEFDDED
jgi:hypothetical protein